MAVNQEIATDIPNEDFTLKEGLVRQIAVVLDVLSCVPTEIYTWRMAFLGMLRRVVLVRTDLSEELSASFIKVTRIVELGTTLAVLGC
jgi:hypothetical protein